MKLLASSVVRSSKLSESHGNLYLVDTTTQKAEKVFEWTDPSIDFSGRGGERGLRGIAYYNEYIYVAKHNGFIVLDKKFNLIDAVTQKYCRDIHEIAICDDILFLASTMYNSIIVYNLKSKRFINSYNVHLGKTFNPGVENDFEKKDIIHLNNVYIGPNKRLIYSGLKTAFVKWISAEQLSVVNENELIYGANIQEIPVGTHNVQPFKHNMIMNDTKHNRIILQSSQKERLRNWVIYNNDDNLTTDFYDDKIARPNFGRGLCYDNFYIYGGSSPSTISVYTHVLPLPIKKIQLTSNIRHAIHGLEIWPY